MRGSQPPLTDLVPRTDGSVVGLTVDRRVAICVVRRKLSDERYPPLVDQILRREGLVVGLITKGGYLTLVSARSSVMRGSHYW
jgi:hypothetical protein